MLMFMIHPLNHQLYTCTFTLKNVSWLKITLLLSERRQVPMQINAISLILKTSVNEAIIEMFMYFDNYL